MDDCCDLVDLSYNNRTQVNFNVNTADSKADIVLTDLVFPPSLLPHYLVVQECPVGGEVANNKIELH